MHAQLLRARCPGPPLRGLTKALKERLCGRRKALLIGIQNATELVEECNPASAVESAVGPSPITSMPRAPRKKGHKVKKTKGASRAQAGETDALKGPHHDVQAMYDVLISASPSILVWCLSCLISSGLDVYGYYAEDIVVLIDDGDPLHAQPTRGNIVRC